MIFRILFLCLPLGLCLVAGGCRTLGGEPASISAPPPVMTEAQVQMIKPELLPDAKTLAIRPFTPGPAVPADAETERLARSFVEGFRQGWDDHEHPLALQDLTRGAPTDVVLYGRIIERENPPSGLLRRWTRRKTEQALGVEAELVEYQTGRLILRLDSRKASSATRLDFMESARELGEEAAQAVAAAANSQNQTF